MVIAEECTFYELDGRGNLITATSRFLVQQEKIKMLTFSGFEDSDIETTADMVMFDPQSLEHFDGLYISSILPNIVDMIPHRCLIMCGRLADCANMAHRVHLNSIPVDKVEQLSMLSRFSGSQVNHLFVNGLSLEDIFVL